MYIFWTEHSDSTAGIVSTLLSHFLPCSVFSPTSLILKSPWQPAGFYVLGVIKENFMVHLLKLCITEQLDGWQTFPHCSVHKVPLSFVMGGHLHKLMMPPELEHKLSWCVLTEWFFRIYLYFRFLSSDEIKHPSLLVRRESVRNCPDHKVVNERVRTLVEKVFSPFSWKQLCTIRRRECDST